MDIKSKAFRRSKQDKLLEGAIKILKDNKKIDVINTFDYFVECYFNRYNFLMLALEVSLTIKMGTPLV